MIRSLVILIALLASACAPKSHDPEPVTCEMASDVYQVKYPDGITRKSNVFACSNHCERIEYVNDSTQQFTQCE